MPRPRVGYMRRTSEGDGVYSLACHEALLTTQTNSTMYRTQFHKALRSSRLTQPHHVCRKVSPLARAAFSTSGRRDIMGLTGFT